MNSINDIHALGTIQRSEYCRPFKLVQDGPGILPEAVGDGLTLSYAVLAPVKR